MMEKNKLAAILPIITAALCDKICKTYHLSEDIALNKLYRTEFYKYLEQEETKFWQYSVEKLFDLYQQEIENGKIDLPEY